VSHAGLVLLRALADNIGLTGGLSRALASDRLLVHDRGRVLADLACAIAAGAQVISDFRVMGDQREVFGLVASVPTCWRALDETAAGGGRALGRITVAVNAARGTPGHPARQPSTRHTRTPKSRSTARQADLPAAPGQCCSAMMTRQARPSTKIIGFDTHMILEAVPARPSEPPNGHQLIKPDITPLCRGPGAPGACRLYQGTAVSPPRFRR
jgi:hypothetical protein